MTAAHAFLAIAAIPFIYYLIAIYSSWRYFNQPVETPDPEFHPPVSNLKPMRGLDPEAYENLSSFCRQDYPDYEIIFCIDSDDQAVISVIDQLKTNFPERRIRVLYGSGRIATNDKVAKLARLVQEAAHEVVVISDSDVRVRPDYLRHVTAPLRDPKIGAVTCFYTPTEIHTFTDHLQTAGMTSDFYAGVLVAWQLDGIKFALGTTIATTKAHLAGFGGYASIENQPADDLLVGRLIAEQGYEVVLLPYVIETVPDYHSMQALFLQTIALAGGHAARASLRPSWIAAHAGPAVVDRGRRRSSFTGRRACIPGNVLFPTCSHDLDHRHPRIEAAALLEANAAHPAMGRSGVPDLAGQLSAPKHSLARRGLLHPRRKTSPTRVAHALLRAASPLLATPRENHPPTSTTPHNTINAPTARRAPILSCRTSLANTVSNAKLAAEAGTAKLSGSVCTSAMNEKNDTAMHAIAKIKNRRRAISLTNLIRPRAPTDCSPARFISKLCSRSLSTVAATITATRIHFIRSGHSRFGY